MGIDVLPDESGSHHTEYNEQLGNGANHHTAGDGANRNQGKSSYGVESANGNRGTSSYGVESASGIRGASSHGVEKCKPEPRHVIIRGWMGQTESETDRHSAEDGTTDFGASLYGSDDNRTVQGIPQRGQRRHEPFPRQGGCRC